MKKRRQHTNALETARHHDAVQESVNQGRLIINLSKKALTEDKTAVLRKGLVFVPTSLEEQFRLISKSHQFFHKFAFRLFFRTGKPLTVRTQDYGFDLS